MTKSSAEKPLSRLYRFIFLVALFYALVTPVWWVMSPVYSRVLCSAANFAFQFNILSSDKTTYSYDNGKITGEVTFVIGKMSNGSEVKIAARPVWEARLHHFSFTIWAALILATPFGNWKKKAVVFILGWSVVFAGQLFSLFVETLSEKSLFLQGSDMFANFRLSDTEEYILSWGGRFFLLVGNKLLPMILWFFVGLPALLKSSGARRLSARLPMAQIREAES